MKIFLAGIVQGSKTENQKHDQGYRERIKKALTENLAGCEVYCPIESHPNSLDYEAREGRTTFFEHTAMAADADCVVAYCPEASMGTAVEMWEAYNNGHPVLAISPMGSNWTVKFLADKVFATLEEFEAFAATDDLRELIGAEEEFEEEEEEYEDEEEVEADKTDEKEADDEDAGDE